MSVAYEVKRSMGDGSTAVKLSAKTGGTELAAEYDTDEQLKEATSARAATARRLASTARRSSHLRSVRPPPTRHALRCNLRMCVAQVSAARTVEVSDRKVDVQPSWLVKAKTARVKLMSALGDRDSVSAQVDYDTNSGDAEVELGFSRQLKDGKSLSATLAPKNKDLEVNLVDSSFEDGATWTATANVPLEDASNVKNNAKVTLKRSWAW